MKLPATSLLCSIAFTAVMSLANHSAIAQALVYDARSTTSYSGFQYFQNDDPTKPKFGSSRSSSNDLFVMGPEEVVTVDGTEYGRHSYAVIELYTWKSGGTTFKEYYVDANPVDPGDQYSGANPTLCQMDAAKKNVMLVVDGATFSNATGRATFGKPIKTAPSFSWYATTITGKSSGVYPIFYPDDSSLLANEPYYGTSYAQTVTAKLNTKLTESVYLKNFQDALAAVIADLESKGFVEGTYEE